MFFGFVMNVDILVIELWLLL